MNQHQRQPQNKNQGQSVENAQIRLNLGAGNTDIPGFIPIDRKAGREVYPLDFPDGAVDEIRASHILEHFSHRKIAEVISHWVGKLRPGGLLRIAVPDFRKIAQRYLDGKKVNAVGYIMGGHIDDDDRHGAIFDSETLSVLMKSAGLSNISVWESEVEDCAALPISLNLQGTKMDNQNKNNWIPEGVKVIAIMSAPRFGPMDNMLCAMNSFSPLGIRFRVQHGVYWAQTLTRSLEDYIAEGYDWIFTTDYDSWYTYRHVIRLCQVMRDNPDADALVSVEIKRDGELPILGISDKEVPLSIFNKSMTPIVTGHFGLTLLRAEMLRKLEKPWFLPVPDPNKSWRDGRIDEDIYFWRRFTEQGFKAYVVNDCGIGHMQLFCTFPGRAEDSFKPIHMPLDVLEKDGPPPHCVPKIESFNEV